MQAILQQEDLWITTTTNDNLSSPVGIRTFRKGAENLESETDHLLCLLKHFESRHILEEALWQTEVLPAVSSFAEQIVGLGKPVTLHLDTHISTAFALGYYIGNKSGTDISIVQKSPKGGRAHWRADDTIAEAEQQWDFLESLVDEGGTDLAVAISISNDVSAEVEQYAKSQMPGIIKILHAKPKCGCGFTAIKDANHILQYIEHLNKEIRAWKVANRSGAKLHLFISAPNAFCFFLGEHASGYGRIILYEYDFEGLRSQTYLPSLSLPL